MVNAITWFELPAADFDRAVTFYDSILATPLQRGEFFGHPHGFFPSDKTGVGGAVVLDPRLKPADTGTVVYLDCNGKLDDVIGRVEASGRKVLLPKTHIGDPGYIALVRDTEGNTVGLHSPA